MIFHTAKDTDTAGERSLNISWTHRALMLFQWGFLCAPLPFTSPTQLLASDVRGELEKEANPPPPIFPGCKQTPALAEQN